MRLPFMNAPLERLILLTALTTLPVASLRAQTKRPPIEHALYVALGGDPSAGSGYATVPAAISAGAERTRADSRWSFRLGADYRRQSADGRFGSTRWEDFGVSLVARYGRSSGVIRPYALGGFGVADLRSRGRALRYYSDEVAAQFPPQSFDNSRWNGALLTGVGTEVRVGRLKLFTEARLNLYPGSLSEHPRPSSTVAKKALFLGVKF